MTRSLVASCSLVLAVSAGGFVACGGAEPAPLAPSATCTGASPSIANSVPSATTSAVVATTTSASATTNAAQLSPAIDEAAVAAATGVEKPEKSADGVVKASWPRKDVDVAVDGWKMPPFMGLTSWVAFSPGRAGVAEAMVMGDLVLFEDEVNPVMSKLLDGGLQVTALHNHFFFDQPHVFFMHVGGEGSVADLGKGMRVAMDEIAAKETVIVERAVREVVAAYPDIEKKYKTAMQTCVRDVTLVVRYVTQAMVRSDPQYLNDGLLTWLATILKGVGFAPHFIEDTYKILGLTASKELSPATAKLLQPFWLQCASVLSGQPSVTPPKEG